jgi:tetratricopeptide (TPR) repeat protein
VAGETEAFGGNNAESFYDDGLTASMKGDLDRAIKCFERAIHLDRSLAAAYHQIAKCYLRLGHGKRAVDVLQQVVTKRPEQSAARLDLGHALIKTGDTETARQQFYQLIALDPTNARAHLGMAQAYFADGNGREAMQEAQTAVNVGGNNFAALFMLGRAAKLAGDNALAAATLEKADKIIERTLESNPEGPEGLFLRGDVAFAREQFSTALEYFRDARDKTDAENPARVYSAYGENFTRADVYGRIGLCFQRLGKLDRAKEIGEDILKDDPNHEVAKSLVGGGD